MYLSTRSQVASQVRVLWSEGILMGPLQIFPVFWIWLDTPPASGHCESTLLLCRRKPTQVGVWAEMRWGDGLGSKMTSFNPPGNMMPAPATRRLGRIGEDDVTAHWWRKQAIKAGNKCDMSVFTLSGFTAADLKRATLRVRRICWVGRQSH